MNKKAINTIATYSGTRASAISRFVRKYELNAENLARDIVKNKILRKDLASALSGYDDNELATTIAQKYRMDESRRADDFFTSKHGKAILNLLNQNGKVFNSELVKQYFNELNPNDIKWTKLMNFIASDLGLILSNYNTYNEQEVDMINAIEKLYREYTPSTENVVVTKKTINEMVDRTVQIDSKAEEERKALKRIVINVDQFEALLNLLLNMNIKPVNIQEGALDDKYTFEVYASRSKTFLDFIKTLPGISMKNMKRDNHYWYITLTNSGRFEEWEPVVKFYKEQIKI